MPEIRTTNSSPRELSGEVKALFDPAVAQITGLLGAQLDSVRRAKNKLPAVRTAQPPLFALARRRRETRLTPSQHHQAVILCGGFSGSRLYLRSSVKTYMQQWQQEYNDNDQQVWGTIRLQVHSFRDHHQT